MRCRQHSWFKNYTIIHPWYGTWKENPTVFWWFEHMNEHNRMNMKRGGLLVICLADLQGGTGLFPLGGLWQTCSTCPLSDPTQRMKVQIWIGLLFSDPFPNKILSLLLHFLHLSMALLHPSGLHLKRFFYFKRLRFADAKKEKCYVELFCLIRGVFLCQKKWMPGGRVTRKIRDHCSYNTA